MHLGHSVIVLLYQCGRWEERQLTVLVLQENGQHFAAVKLVSIKRHLGLVEKQETKSG